VERHLKQEAGEGRDSRQASEKRWENAGGAANKHLSLACSVMVSIHISLFYSAGRTVIDKTARLARHQSKYVVRVEIFETHSLPSLGSPFHPAVLLVKIHCSASEVINSTGMPISACSVDVEE
jgi:hypothetical protein